MKYIVFFILFIVGSPIILTGIITHFIVNIFRVGYSFGEDASDAFMDWVQNK